MFNTFIYLAYIMQQSQKTTKKWTDFSSDQSDDQQDLDHDIPLRSTLSEPVKLRSQNSHTSTKPSIDHRSKEFIEQEINKFQSLGEGNRDVWIIVQSANQSLLDKKIKNFKEDQNSGVIHTFINRDIKGAWDLKVKKQVAEEWLKNGIDQDRNIKISMSEKNFRSKNQNYDNKNRNGDKRGYKNNNYDRGQNGGRGQRRDRGDRGDRGDRSDRGDRGGRRGGRGGRRREGQQNGHQLTQQQRQQRRINRNNRNDEPRQKKVYVDKVTGKAPSNKEETQKKIIEQKERHYTKQQAQKVGLQLGNFRNKPKNVELKPQIEIKPVQQPVRKERQKQRQRQKEEPKAWSRKQRVIQEKTQIKKVEYRQKNGGKQYQNGFEQKPKKKYVIKKVQGQQEKDKKKETNGLLSEDSN